MAPGEKNPAGERFRAGPRFARPLVLILAALVLGSCVSMFDRAGRTLVEGAGRLLDGSAFRERTRETWRNRDGGPGGAGLVIRRVLRKGADTGGEWREFLLITPEAFPALTLRGSAPGADGRFVLEALEFLSPNLDGYHEWSRELAGAGFFVHDGYAAFFALYPGTGSLDIEAGRIRRGALRLSGDAALRALRDRDARIEALTSWMEEYVREEPGRSGADRSGPVRQDGGSKAFGRRWEPVLFPELVPAARRSALWASALGDAAAEADDPWQKGEDIRWNRAYSRLLLPEELRPIRDSGTMLRDWEEALEWIYCQFEWQSILSSLTGENPLSASAIRLVKE